jgi:hypothetical protein
MRESAILEPDFDEVLPAMPIVSFGDRSAIRLGQRFCVGWQIVEIFDDVALV